jgi:hypothetical protein
MNTPNARQSRALRGVAVAALVVACLQLAGCADYSGWQEKALSVPVPAGGSLVDVYSPTRLHGGEQPMVAYARYSYAASASMKALGEEQEQLLNQSGMRVHYRRFVNDTEAGSGLAAVTLHAWQAPSDAFVIEVGRWGPEGGGCCVWTDDPERPITLEVTFLPDHEEPDTMTEAPSGR